MSTYKVFIAIIIELIYWYFFFLSQMGIPSQIIMVTGDVEEEEEEEQG